MIDTLRIAKMKRVSYRILQGYFIPTLVATISATYGGTFEAGCCIGYLIACSLTLDS